jgi:hypothetical protein
MVDRPLVFDRTIDDDAAADGIAITLGHNVGEDCWLGGGDVV